VRFLDKPWGVCGERLTVHAQAENTRAAFPVREEGLGLGVEVTRTSSGTTDDRG